MKKRIPFPDAIRNAIQQDSRTPYRLAEESGVARAVLSRFLTGKRDLNLRTADRLCETLGLELRPTKRTRKGG